MKQLRYFSMFTGVGGFEMGIQRAYEALNFPEGEREQQGGDEESCPDSFGSLLGSQQPTCVGFSEVDKYASAVLRYRYPNTKNYGDCSKIIWSDVPDFNLLVGGSPCQDFSIAGKRAGLDGKRSGLFIEFLRAIKEKQPEYFIWENVKGTLSSRGGWDFANIQVALAEAGYELWWQVINATATGVPQNRERIFIVGTRSDIGSPREIFFEARVREEAVGVQQAEQGEGERLSGEVPQAGREDVNAESGGRIEGRSRGCLKELTKGVGDAHRIYDPSGPAKSLKALGGGMGAKTGLYAVDIDGEEFIVRRLMPSECMSLMSWPTDWCDYGDFDGETKEISDSQKYRMAGNGVVSEVVKHVVMEHIP